MDAQCYPDDPECLLASYRRSEPAYDRYCESSTREEWLRNWKHGRLGKDVNSRTRLYSHIRELPYQGVSGWKYDNFNQKLLKSGVDPLVVQHDDIPQKVAELERSPVLFEDFTRPPTASDDRHVAMFTLDELLQFLQSDKWPDQTCLRLVGGPLLDMFVRVLVDMELNKILISHSLHGFLNQRRQKLNHEDSIESIDWLYETLHVHLIMYNIKPDIAEFTNTTKSELKSEIITSMIQRPALGMTKYDLDEIRLPTFECLSPTTRIEKLTSEKIDIEDLNKKVAAKHIEKLQTDASKNKEKGKKNTEVTEVSKPNKVDKDVKPHSSKSKSNKFSTKVDSSSPTPFLPLNSSEIEWVTEIPFIENKVYKQKEEEEEEENKVKDAKISKNTSKISFSIENTRQAGLATSMKTSPSKSLLELTKYSETSKNPSSPIDTVIKDTTISPQYEEGQSHVNEGNEEGQSHVNEGNEEGQSHVNEGNEEGQSHVNEGNEEGQSHVNEGNEEGQSHVNDGNNEGQSHVNERNEEGRSHEIDGNKTASAENLNKERSLSTFSTDNQTAEIKERFKQRLHISHNELHIPGLYPPKEENRVLAIDKLKQIKRVRTEKLSLKTKEIMKKLEDSTNDIHSKFKCLARAKELKRIKDTAPNVEKLKKRKDNGKTREQSPQQMYHNERQCCELGTAMFNPLQRRILQSITETKPNKEIHHNTEKNINKAKKDISQNHSNILPILNDPKINANTCLNKSKNVRFSIHETNNHISKLTLKKSSSYIAFERDGLKTILDGILSWRNQLDKGIIMHSGSPFSKSKVKVENTWMDQNGNHSNKPISRPRKAQTLSTNSSTRPIKLKQNKMLKCFNLNNTSIQQNKNRSSINANESIKESSQIDEKSIQDYLSEGESNSDVSMMSEISNRKQILTDLKSHFIECMCEECLSNRNMLAHLCPEEKHEPYTYPPVLGKLSRDYNFLKNLGNSTACLNVEKRNDPHFPVFQERTDLPDKILNIMKHFVLRKEIITSSKGVTFTTITFSNPQLYSQIDIPT